MKKSIEQITKEIKTEVEKIWGNAKYPYEEPDDIEVEVAKDGSYVDITISAMYGTPGCTFDQMAQLSQFFGTTNIGNEDDFAYGGCETCDYGSKYGFTLRISKPKSTDKPITQSTHGWFLTR